MAFSNGTLDLNTQEMLPDHRQIVQLIFCSPFHYEPNAECPQWHDFIENTYIKADGTPDPAVVNAALPYEVAFDVGGLKGCGKGVTLEVLRALNGCSI